MGQGLFSWLPEGRWGGGICWGPKCLYWGAFPPVPKALPTELWAPTATISLVLRGAARGERSAPAEDLQRSGGGWMALGLS